MSRSRVINLANLQQFTAINVLSDPGAIGGPKIIGSTAEIELVWGNGAGRTEVNVLHGRYSGTFAGTQAQANSMLTALTTGTNWTAMALFMPPDSSLAQVRIRDINTRDQPQIQSTATGAVGTSPGTALPLEVAICVTLRTAFTGPQNRGRIYIPNWATNALGSNNTIASACVTAAQNWALTIAGILNAQGYLFSIGHVARQAYTGSTGTQHPARTDGTVPVVTVAVRDNHWDSQRRRGLR